MNKGELVEAVAQDIKESKAVAEKAVNSVLNTIKSNVNEGVNLIGFGTFQISERAARTGRNPKTGEEIRIEASKTVRFKPGKAFKESL
ncbi:MAG: HU family DNA-binding protein [Chitinispirillaceae bacterium]